MMKRFVFCSCLALALFNIDCLGMEMIKSDSDILSQHKADSVTHGRMLSDPVTAKEKAHAIEITSMKQFRKLTSDQTKELKSVTFREMEINEEFVDKFWELFSCGIKELSFESCHAVDGYTFSYLFDSLYQVVNLKIIGCELSIEDAGAILSLVSPYVIRIIDFSKNTFSSVDASFVSMVKQKVTGRMCLDTPILCTP